MISILLVAFARKCFTDFGENWKSGENFRPPPDWDTGFEFRGGGYTDVGADDHSTLFEELFGRRPGGTGGAAGQRTFRIHGEDHHAKVLIDLEDSYTGATRSISLRMPELTDDGQVTTREHTLNVRIPKGIRPGQHIRLAGQGGPGIGGGESGDLYLEVEFSPNRIYRVDGADVYLDLPIAPWEAALGTTLKAPTPSGAVDLKIPENSNQGKKLRLKGLGPWRSIRFPR